MKVLIIGATGSIGQAVRQQFLTTTDAQLTLFSRHAQQITNIDPAREVIVTGDARHIDDLNQVMSGQDFVFVALSGRMNKFAQAIVASMELNKAKRLVFITTMGIYREIPRWLGSAPDPYHSPILRPFRLAADIIEDSDLDYTIIRPGWYTDGSINYELTSKGSDFGGHDVSRASIADYVVKLAKDPTLGIRESNGINIPTN